MNRLTNQVWNLQGTPLASFAYTLGPTGNRTNLAETVNGTVRSYAWAYDSLYRLTQETLAGGTSGTLNYSYDLVGNRTNRTSSLSVLTNQSLAYTANDWLTNDAYDSNGNTTNSSGNSYQYDALNHATNVNNGGILLAYDGDGNRTRKTVSGTTTYYLLDDRNPSGYVQVLEEWTAAGGTTNLNRVYNYGLNLVSQRAPGSSTNYFVFDGHGSTRMLTDIGGTAQNVFAYDAYGTLIASNTTPQTAYLYCGQQFDGDMGCYDQRARYLNANTGKFWSRDTDEGSQDDPLSFHKYLYCEADPVDGIDPDGTYDEYASSMAQTFSQVFEELPNLVHLTQSSLSTAPVVVVTPSNGAPYEPQTKVKDSAQAGIFGLPIGTPIHIPVPKSVDPQGLVDMWAKKSSSYYTPSFFWYWRPGGENDYKRTISQEFDAFGNFEYGATGAGRGMTLNELKLVDTWATRIFHFIPANGSETIQ